MSQVETGVYCWYNRVNGKRYVGSAARSFRQRKQDHLSELRRDKSPCTYLKHAWKKNGESAFEFIILERCHPDECLAREQHWIDFYKSADPNFGYNTNPIAGSMRGRRWKRKTPRPPVTDETRQKLAEVWRGRKHTEETKEKMRAAAIGKNKGRKLTEEHKAKISWKGRKHTEETRAKISASNLGKNKGKKLPKSAETRARMAEAAKIRWTTRNRVFSEETKRRMSEAAKLRWIQRKLKYLQAIGAC